MYINELGVESMDIVNIEVGPFQVFVTDFFHSHPVQFFFFNPSPATHIYRRAVQSSPLLLVASILTFAGERHSALENDQLHTELGKLYLGAVVNQF